MITRRSWLVYGTLLAIWFVLIGWQAVEHIRVRHSAQQKLVDRTKDISNTLGLLMRSQRFFGVITRERLEPVLNDLVKPGELHPVSVEIVNVSYEKVASAGPPIELPRGELPGGVYWDDKARTLTLQNIVDLGTNVILSSGELFPTNRPPRRSETNGPPPNFEPGGGPPLPPPDGNPGDEPRRSAISLTTNATSTNQAIAPLANLAGLANTNASSTNSENRRRGSNRRRDPERPFERPFWMNQEEYQSTLQKKGVHGFIIVMSTQSLIPTLTQDLWLRCIVAVLATIAVAGFGLAWRNAARTAELQIRLVRASELNSHLKEMNLAAAGLAHETRNPLNIVRGLAQMISRREDATPEIQQKSKEMIEETDRVTAQLNEFINYSRPREVRRAATNLTAVVAEVVRALTFDIEEKKVRVQTIADPLIIEADEQLLRQALFNLVLNAVQAVTPNGEIQIRAHKTNGSSASVEVADNGPGVAPENRSEIFKPYFTTHAEGTGLGLAVVQQIVLAHGWEIECLANQPAGAILRITHLKLAAKS
jgi:signal transduction histidine kinase